MKRFFLILLLVLFYKVTLFSQTKAAANPYLRIDRLMDVKNDSMNNLSLLGAYINAHYVSDYEKSRAIFYWITQNIRYAPELMYTFTSNENRARLAKEVFENRTAVCIGFAVLYDSLCKLTQVPSYVVLGSTRQSFLPNVIGHAWNAVKVLDEWQIVDATWGSGYLNGNTFIRSRNDYYFFPDAQKLVLTHLPLDPIWQMLNKPLSLYQFHSQLRPTTTVEWNYNDSIKQFLATDELHQIKATARRLAAFGNNSEVTSNYSQFLKAKEYEFYHIRMKLAVKNYNKAADQFNVYVEFKNHQFSPAKPDSSISKMIPEVRNYLNESEKQYALVINEITEPDYIESINANQKQITELKGRAAEEQKFVDKYLSTKKNKRRDLFYTKIYTIYGVPIK